MKKFVIIAIAIFILTLTDIICAEPDITAPCAILIDSKSGKVLYEKNADQKMFPASTTKVMTGILGVEHGNFEKIITVSPNCTNIERGSSQMSLVPGEELKFEDILYGLMLVSGNDAAIAVAEEVGGSFEEFSKLMNQRAKEIGAKNTNFVNPNGLHNDSHYTTARDLALIAKHGMTLPKFREIVGTVSHPIEATNKQPKRDYITNGNKLIWKNYDKYRYEYAIGIKTGYTTVAEHCLVSAALKDNTELIAVVLGVKGSNMYNDSIKMFEYGFSNYEYINLIKENQIITTIPVSDAEISLNLLAQNNLDLLLNKDEQKRINSKITINENIAPPIAAGEILGNISYILDEKEISKTNLIAEVEVQKPKKKHNYLLWFFIFIPCWMTFIAFIRRAKKLSK